MHLPYSAHAPYQLNTLHINCTLYTFYKALTTLIYNACSILELGYSMTYDVTCTDIPSI